MFDFIMRMFAGAPATQAQSGPGMLVCQAASCRERYDLDKVVTISDDDVMSMLTGARAGYGHRWTSKEL